MGRNHLMSLSVEPSVLPWLSQPGSSQRGALDTTFATVDGMGPVPASRANMTRHRLSRGCDRRVNGALSLIALA